MKKLDKTVGVFGKIGHQRSEALEALGKTGVKEVHAAKRKRLLAEISAIVGYAYDGVSRRMTGPSRYWEGM